MAVARLRVSLLKLKKAKPAYAAFSCLPARRKSGLRDFCPWFLPAGTVDSG